MWLVQKEVPLSAKSFYSALLHKKLHKKDTAAIGAILEASVFRGNIYERDAHPKRMKRDASTIKKQLIRTLTISLKN